MKVDRKRVATILLVALLIGVVLVLVPSGAVAEPSNNEELTEAEDGLFVWERAMFPLRADRGTAETSFETHTKFVEDDEYGKTTAFPFEEGVYAEGDDVSFEFLERSGIDTSQFADNDTQVVIASYEGNPAIDDVGGYEALNDTITPALEGDFDELRSQAEDRDVEFEVDDGLADQLDEDGEVEFDLQVDEAGPYVIMLVRPDDAAGEGFDTDNGDLELPGEATILGMESIVVHERESSIDVSGAEPGDTIEVDASTDLNGDINHSVLVYNEDTFIDDDEEMTFVFDGEFGESFSEDEVTVEHTIATVNGIGDIPDGSTLYGFSASERTVSGTTPVGNIFDQLTDASDLDIDNESTDQTVIDASGAVDPRTGADSTIQIETFNNWTEGTYRVLHVADNGTVQGLETSTRAITIEEDDPPTTTRGTRSRSRPDPEPEPDPTEIPAENVVAEESQLAIDADPDRPGTQVRFTQTQSIEEISFESEELSPVEEISVSESDRVPETVSPPQRAVRSVTRVTVGDALREEPATVTFRLPRDAIETSPENVVVEKYDDSADEWDDLETRVRDDGEDVVRFEADTPGFSLFAVTEDEAEPEPEDEAEPEPEDEAEPEPEDEADDPADLPGFGVGLALVALLVAALLAMRRSDK